MSTKITSYYLPNKIANSYVANKRNASGEYLYDAEIADVGMETQAAIQSLTKSYSSTINDAYTNYLNSKRSILNSNLTQGYKEAYLREQEQNLRANIEQAGLTAASTKQEILQSYKQQEAAIGEAFQADVVNMNKVGAQLENYMNYLKTVKSGGTSYFDAIVKGKGLESVDASIGVKAEDIYDALYNAAPTGYKTEKSETALNWMDWLKTQITTDKDQTWYDWYVGQGGYEQFQDAYQKGVVGTAAKHMAEQAEKNRQQQAYDVTRYNINKSIDDIETPDLNTAIKWHDFGLIDTGITGTQKIADSGKNVANAIKAMGVTDDELYELTGYKNAEDIMLDISRLVQSKLESKKHIKTNFSNDFVSKYFDEPAEHHYKVGGSSSNTKFFKELAVNAYNALMTTIKNYAKDKKYKEQNVYGDFVYSPS